MIFSRRSLILGATVSLIAAPAIVRASSLMAVKPFELLSAAGMDIPIDLELHDYLAQYQSFQKGFLKEYRNIGDNPIAAKNFDVGSYASLWSGDHIPQMPQLGRADRDDGILNLTNCKKRNDALMVTIYDGSIKTEK